MGWASASDLYDKVIAAARKSIPDDTERTKFHVSVINAFEDHDWDTQEECLGDDTAFDMALSRLHPEWDEEEG